LDRIIKEPSFEGGFGHLGVGYASALSGGEGAEALEAQESVHASVEAGTAVPERSGEQEGLRRGEQAKEGTKQEPSAHNCARCPEREVQRRRVFGEKCLGRTIPTRV